MPLRPLASESHIASTPTPARRDDADPGDGDASHAALLLRPRVLGLEPLHQLGDGRDVVDARGRGAGEHEPCSTSPPCAISSSS